jgi:hypothetical protein
MSKSGLLLLFIIVLCIMQIFLVKKKSKWAGLMLPLISFVFSVFLIVISPNFISIIFILANIPTAIYLTIFFMP